MKASPLKSSPHVEAWERLLVSPLKIWGRRVSLYTETRVPVHLECGFSKCGSSWCLQQLGSCYISGIAAFAWVLWFIRKIHSWEFWPLTFSRERKRPDRANLNIHGHCLVSYFMPISPWEGIGGHCFWCWLENFGKPVYRLAYRLEM